MRPKILHVTQATGGVETSLLLLFRHLDRASFELHLACPPGTALEQRAADFGVMVHPVAMVRHVSPLGDALAVGSLCRLMRRERYSLVHAHSAKGGYLARIAARLTGTRPALYSPRAFSYLSQRGLAQWFFLALERLARPLTDVVVATSQSERRRAIVDVGFDPGRVVVVPNGVDLTEIGRYTGEPAADDGAPTVLMVGRLSYQKNAAMFVRVARRVAARHPTVRFVLNGGGFASPEEASVRVMIARAGLGDRLTVAPWGAKEVTLDRIARCSVFALTSRFEGMPNTILEAMALGRPVVATDVDGTRDVVRHGETGFLVPVDADPAMADAIERLLEDRDQARRLGERAAAVAARDYDVRNTVRGVAEVYRAVLHGRSRTAGVAEADEPGTRSARVG